METNKGLIFGVDKSIIQLTAIVAFVFVFPVIDNKMVHDLFASISYTLVLLSIFSIIEDRTKKLSYLVIVAVVSNLILFVTDDTVIRIVTFSISALTFIFATGVLISHVSSSKNVTLGVVIQAISGYLLLGIIGVLINTILLLFNENALSFSGIADKFSSIIYYSFITLTTIAYGEIVPESAAARSVAIFIGVAGQLYLTVIIALIIGKFLSADMRK